jgi:hypothetical protein
MKKFSIISIVLAEARTLITVRGWMSAAGPVVGIGICGYRWEMFLAIDQERGAIRVM